MKDVKDLITEILLNKIQSNAKNRDRMKITDTVTDGSQNCLGP